MHRFVAISLRANSACLEALASVEDTVSTYRENERLCEQ